MSHSVKRYVRRTPVAKRAIASSELGCFIVWRRIIRSACHPHGVCQRPGPGVEPLDIAHARGLLETPTHEWLPISDASYAPARPAVGPGNRLIGARGCGSLARNLRPGPSAAPSA